MATLRDIQLRAATDAAFRAALLRDPYGTLELEGVGLPEGVELEIIEAASNRLPLVIPPLRDELDEIDLEPVVGGTGPPGASLFTEGIV